MRKPNEPVADTSAASKLRRWGPIALQDLFDCLSKSGSYSAKTENVAPACSLSVGISPTVELESGTPGPLREVCRDRYRETRQHALELQHLR
jgi:hypothetical protein